MRLRFTVALLACALASAIGSREPAPKFHATTLDGQKYTNDSVKGKAVLVQFWTTWCRYCRGDQQAVDRVYQEFRQKGLVVLAVNVGEGRRKVKDYLERSPRAVPVVLTEDTNLAAALGAKSFPYYVLIDKEGKIGGNQEGAGGEGALRELLKKAGLRSGE